MNEINLKDMSNKTAVRIMMEGTEYDQFQKIAKALDLPKSSFQSSLDRDSLKIKDLQEVAELLGYELKLIKK